jgi:hypothetical protein
LLLAAGSAVNGFGIRKACEVDVQRSTFDLDYYSSSNNKRNTRTDFIWLSPSLNG